MMLRQMPYGHYGCEVGVTTLGLHLLQVRSTLMLVATDALLVALMIQCMVPFPFTSGGFHQDPKSMLSRATGML